MMDKFFKNEAKEIIKQYLFWVDFLDQSFSSLDELKDKLRTIKDRVVYRGGFNNFYLTKEEAQALGSDLIPVTIEEILDSDLISLHFIERLQRITSYSKKDLKFIPKKSEVVWFYNVGVLMHFVLKDGKYIYPKSYPVDSPYRYGYIVVFRKDGLRGIYDIESGSLKISFEYSSIELFGNLAQLSKDDINYEIIDLDKNETLQTTKQRAFENLSDALKEKLNLAKVDLEDYVTLFDTPKTEQDLRKMGLWNAKVGVLDVPSDYAKIIEEQKGNIGWAYPVSADIFDMHVELPVIFRKRDGEYVTLGINHENIVLEERTILNDVKFPKKSEKKDSQELPNYLKIKNEAFNDVDISNNRVDAIIELSSAEFNEFVSLLGNDNISMLLTYLKTLDDIELAEFLLYLESVTLDERVDAPSAKEQFEHLLENTAEDLSDTLKARATLEIPLFVNYAKHLHHQAVDFKEFIRAKYYPYKEDDATMQFEGYLFKTLYSEPMKFIPDYFNQILTQFRDYYDGKNDEHQKIGLHLAKRFGLLANSLHVIQKFQNEPHDGLEWFLATFVEEIKKVDGYDILSDDILIFYMMNTFSSIIQEDDQSYITSMIEVVKELMKYYPYLSDSFLYVLQELMKSVALKEMSVDNANRFLEIFEALPKLYNKLNYSKIMELKNLINGILANDKPQDNKVFDEDGVENRLILLNYLVDLEDR